MVRADLALQIVILGSILGRKVSAWLLKKAILGSNLPRGQNPAAGILKNTATYQTPGAEILLKWMVRANLALHIALMRSIFGRKVSIWSRDSYF